MREMQIARLTFAVPETVSANSSCHVAPFIVYTKAAGTQFSQYGSKVSQLAKANSYMRA